MLDFTTLSNTFIICDVKLTGRYCSGFNFEPPLCIGVIWASLNILGIFPSSRLFLRIINNGVDISSLVSLNNLEDTPSGPAVEDGSNFLKGRYLFSKKLFYHKGHQKLIYVTR